MIERLKLWVRCWLVALDQLAYVTLAAPKYLWVGGPVPNPRETISSKVARMAIKGKRWALVCESVIDWLFIRLGSRPGHCRRAIIKATS